MWESSGQVLQNGERLESDSDRRKFLRADVSPCYINRVGWNEDSKAHQIDRT